MAVSGEPYLLVRGDGVRVWDSDGREYLDFGAGIAVTSLGHCHPRVTGAIQEAGFGVNCYVDDELYVAELTEEAKFYRDYQGVPLEVHVVGPLLDWLERPPTKLVVVGFDGALDPLEERLHAELGGRLHVVRSIEFFLEVSDTGVTKAAGLDVAASEAGFTAARTVGFGDNQNDVELLEWAAYGVAVANAHPRLLALADLVCPSVEEEGVAQVIEAFLDSSR